MFVSDVSFESRLARCDLSGANCVTITTGVMVTTGLTVDRRTDYVYYTDSVLDYIFAVTVDGKDNRIIVRYGA